MALKTQQSASTSNDRAIGSFRRASRFAKEAGAKELQKRIADNCCERGQAIGQFDRNYGYQRSAEYYHIASEVAQDIGDPALQKKVAQICFSVAQCDSAYTVDFYTMAAMNDSGKYDPCLAGILTANADFNNEKNKMGK